MTTITAPARLVPVVENVKGNLHDTHHRHKAFTLVLTVIAEVSLIYGVEMMAVHLAFAFAMFGKDFAELLLTSAD